MYCEAQKLCETKSTVVGLLDTHMYENRLNHETETQRNLELDITSENVFCMLRPRSTLCVLCCECSVSAVFWHRLCVSQHKSLKNSFWTETKRFELPSCGLFGCVSINLHSPYKKCRYIETISIAITRLDQTIIKSKLRRVTTDCIFSAFLFTPQTNNK